LSTISFATSESVFTFDVANLGPRVFDDGFRDVLESRSVVKVMHDCRKPFHESPFRPDKVFGKISS
jgi:hypothetical protein